MLNAIIRFALRQRLVVIAAAVFMIGYGTHIALNTRIDVFPNLNRPRVVIITEAPGMAPEEVESLITLPIETALNGASGVQDVRSSSGIGLSVIYVEFNWGTDIYTDRQVVTERLQLVTNRLPEGVEPQLTPISSIMGQILVLGMWSEGNKTSPMKVRTLADWVVRQRLLTIPGVAQVITMGGERKQYQVLVDPDAMRQFGVTLADVEQAVQNANANATGGYLDEQGPNEWLVRSLGRVQTISDLEKVVVRIREGRAVSLAEVATVIEGPQVVRGNSSAFAREEKEPDSDSDRPQLTVWTGGPAVALTINKQPGADTRRLTTEIMEAINDLTKMSLPDDIQIQVLYSQRSFIDRAIDNIIEALRDGGILVVIILFLFLLNFRTTFITLTAIPLSLVMTALVFAMLGVSINTMTLGGLAVAIGELVDDAIVDVENIFRRLKENRHSKNPKPALLVVFQASTEIRNSIVFGTLIVILVFTPLFALGGIEGRLFTPLGIAYIVSILSSLLVSLTVTPVLSYWLLGRARLTEREEDGLVLKTLKWVGDKAIRFSLALPRTMLAGTLLAVGIAGMFLATLERDFLPPFNEGAAQLNVILPPGTSLTSSLEINRLVEQRLLDNPDVLRFVRRTGRAELDEHVEPVSNSEYIIELDPNRPREEQIKGIREDVDDIPGIVFAVEQPISHLISHMLSGIKAQIGIKLYGEDLLILRKKAKQIEADIKTIPGVKDLIVEPQVDIPQLRIKLDRDKLLLYGMTPTQVNEYIETAMNGRVVSEVLQGQRTFDLLIRFKENYREDIERLKRLAITIPEGGEIPLYAIADVQKSIGPNTINREDVRRRITIQCNVEGRGVVDVVEDIQKRLGPLEESLKKLPGVYFIEYGGQFESQQAASKTIGVLFVVSLMGVFLVLYTMFRSVNLSLQVMAALPMAFIGAVIALVISGQTLTVAAMVGFISLAGIASRNGILLLNHYLHLVEFEGEDWTKKMIVRAGLERLAPVLMTALTSGIGLVPLILAAGEPGKEILYPVATVIVGGLISSTLLDFFVHPALFWLFGMKAAQCIIQERVDQVELVEPRDEKPHFSQNRAEHEPSEDIRDSSTT